jgi:4'-phosphopantetheinyl transferase
MAPPIAIGATRPLPHPSLSFELSEEIAVWRVFLDVSARQVSELQSVLAAEELAEAEWRAPPLRRSRFLVARGVRRALLARYLRCHPWRAALRPRSARSPAPTHRPLLKFTQSRSAHIALIAITARHEVGIDVEHVSPDLADRDLARKWFARSESRALMRLPRDLWPVGFFGVWTRKEAYLKATGQGLFYPLDGFAVTTAPGSEAALVSHRVDPDEVQRWRMRTYWPAPVFIATVASRSVEVKLRHFDWPGSWTC